jgi:thioesterase domain-containing protein
MNAHDLQAYLNDRIPLSRAMAITVSAAGKDGVVLRAPLAPNINHRDTVFGGSASAVAILAAWSALYVRMQAEGLRGRIVIRRNTMSYDRPIADGFTVTALPPGGNDWNRLVATLRRGRTARVELSATLDCNGEAVGRLDGEFAVLPGDQTTPDADNASICAAV